MQRSFHVHEYDLEISPEQSVKEDHPSKEIFFDGVSNIEVPSTSKSGNNFKPKFGLMSTKDLTLKKFIDKHKELLLGTLSKPFTTEVEQSPVNRSDSREHKSAVKMLQKLAEIERTNHSRLQLRREESLAKVLTILESLQVYHCFRKLAKNKGYLSGKEVSVGLRSRKRVLRRFLRLWAGQYREVREERASYEQARWHHNRQMMVKAKFIVYKWRKLIKEERKWLETARDQMQRWLVKEVFATWRLMRVKNQVREQVRERHLKVRGLMAFRGAKATGAEEHQMWGHRMKEVVFARFKWNREAQKKKRRAIRVFMKSRKVAVKRMCLDALREITIRLRKTKGDPFLVRRVIGDTHSRRKRHPCDLDSEDDTEFFEVLVNTQSTFVNCELRHALEIDKRESLCLQ